MKRHIVGFHRDAEAHWVAELDCGHNQHVRHDPPWTLRPWVTSAAGRGEALGRTLECAKCDSGAAPDRPHRWHRDPASGSRPCSTDDENRS
jgi:hypothetical protein